MASGYGCGPALAERSSVPVVVRAVRGCLPEPGLTALSATGGVCVLPPENRLRQSREHRRVVRHGARYGGRLLIVHAMASDDAVPGRAGFVVSRAVGGAVTRNAVRRRLRHLVRDRLGRLPAGSRVVVRAQPQAATVSSAVLARELDTALDQLASRWAHDDQSVGGGAPLGHGHRGGRP